METVYNYVALFVSVIGVFALIKSDVHPEYMAYPTKERVDNYKRWAPVAIVFCGLALPILLIVGIIIYN